jgi:hypothetical protein
MRWVTDLGGRVVAVRGAAQRLVVAALGGLWPWVSGRAQPSGPVLFRPANSTLVFRDVTGTTAFRDRSPRLTYQTR